MKSTQYIRSFIVNSTVMDLKKAVNEESRDLVYSFFGNFPLVFAPFQIWIMIEADSQFVSVKRKPNVYSLILSI